MHELLSEGTLYDKHTALINMWFQSETLKSYIIENKLIPQQIFREFLEFSQGLAIYQYINSADSAKPKLPEWLEKLFTNTEEPAKIIKDNCLLQYKGEKDDEKEFIFTHLFLEYFVANQLYQDLNVKQDARWNLRLHGQKILHFVENLIRKNEQNLKTYLWSMVSASKVSAENSTAAANAITVLNYLGTPFIGECGDLAGVNIEGADLSGAILAKADFHNANLNKVNFRNAYMAGANLRGAKMENADFGERANIRLPSKVNAISFSKYGRYMAVASGNDIILYFWNAGDFEEHMRLEGHTDNINMIAFSHDEEILASCGDDNQILLWDLDSFEHIVLVNSHKAYKSIAFSPNEKILASGSENGDIYLWDAESYDKLAFLRGHTEAINTLAFSSNGKILASGADDSQVYLWDVETRDLITNLKQNFNVIKSVTFSPDNHWLAFGAESVYLWDVHDINNPGKLKILESLTSQSYSSDNTTYNCVAFSLDGKRLAAGNSDSSVHLWDIETDLEITHIIKHQAEVTSVVFSPDEEWLVTGGNDQSICQWNAKITQEAAEKPHYSGSVCNTIFNVEGNPIVLLSGKGGISLYDIQNNKTIIKTDFSIGSVLSAAYSPHANIAVFGGSRKELYLWKINESKQPVRLMGKNSTMFDPSIYSVALTQDGKILAATDNNKVLIWDTSNANQINKLEVKGERAGTIYALAFSSDAKLLASGGSDHNLRLWDVSTGQQIAKMIGHSDHLYAVSFHPDGKILASGSSDFTVRLWDVDSATELAILKKHTSTITALAFSPDGTILASGDNDKNVFLWDVQNHSLLAKLGGHIGEINSIAFSSDGKYLLTGCGDGGAFLWGNAGSSQNWLLLNRFANDLTLFAEDAYLEEAQLSLPTRELLEQYDARFNGAEPQFDKSLTQPPFSFWSNKGMINNTNQAQALLNQSQPKPK